jgi:hypothetical protein
VPAVEHIQEVDPYHADAQAALTAQSAWYGGLLLAACEGYLDFATRNPGLYRAIFWSDEQLDELTTPPERARGQAGEGGYNLLVTTLQDVVTATGGTSLNAWDPARHLVDLPRSGDAAPRSRAPFPPGPAVRTGTRPRPPDDRQRRTTRHPHPLRICRNSGD